ncbi:hypothetical protein GCM10010517_49330 [Streptosporangium fragile]|uniref:Uncharacterized protein n=1 Tax=Streptosporangium fragile TaxID=46186 RepID=A0ABN3W2K7_9ACTN
MFLLGVSWLVLAPLCLWNLFRGGAMVRLTSVLALVALEGATIWAGAQLPRPAPIAAPPSPPAAANPGASPTANPTANPTMAAGRTPAVAYGGQAARTTQATQGGGHGGNAASCPARLPAPERLRLARHQGTLRGVTLFWTARADECDTATVVLRHRNRTIKVWMREGGAQERSGAADRRSGVVTGPVSVTGGVASVQVRLTAPLPGAGALRAVDGRTGRPIALS